MIDHLDVFVCVHVATQKFVDEFIIVMYESLYN